LPGDAREDDIQEAFDKYGRVERVNLIYDRRTGRGKGFAFIYFAELEDAIRAKEAGATMTIRGKSVRVDFSRTDRAHSPTPGRYMGRPSDRPSGGSRRYGGGYGGGYDRYEPRSDRDRERERERPYYRGRSRSRSRSPPRYRDEYDDRRDRYDDRRDRYEDRYYDDRYRR
jgi:transformer-2 protein